MNGSSRVVPQLPPNKSSMADGSHIDFRKYANISVIDEDIGHSFVQRCKSCNTDNNCKTAFSFQCSGERGDDYNFYLELQ